MTTAREEHAEAMKKSKLDREMDMTRLKLELQDEMREQTKVSENHEEQKERITKRPTPPPSPPRTPDPILFVESAEFGEEREQGSCKRACSQETPYA